MPKKPPTQSSEPLALLYRNGQPFTSNELDIHIPRFTDICLTKDSQDQCDDAIDLARKYDHAIHSEKEKNDYAAVHSLVDELIDKLRSLAKLDREHVVKICSQQSAAIEPVLHQLVDLSRLLKERITEWVALVREGERREEERLRAKAEEKRAEAKYSPDPKKARQATVEAKELEKEAEKIAPKPQKGGVDTEEYWEGEIINRVQAAKLPENIVYMEVDQTALNKHVKALEHAGSKITPNILPGLAIERKTRVRFHK